jgi:hypothetical protein
VSRFRMARFAFKLGRKSNVTSLRSRGAGGAQSLNFRKEGVGESFLKAGLEELAEDALFIRAFNFDDQKWQEIAEQVIKSSLDAVGNEGQATILKTDFIEQANANCQKYGRGWDPEKFVQQFNTNMEDDKFDAVDLIIEAVAEELFSLHGQIYGNYGVNFALGGAFGTRRRSDGFSSLSAYSRTSMVKSYYSNVTSYSRNAFSSTYTPGRAFRSDAEALASYGAAAARNYGANWNTYASAKARSRETATKHLAKMGYASGLTTSAKKQIQDTRNNVTYFGYRWNP